MGEYQYIGDAQAGAMYEFICEFATLEPPPPELQQFFRAVHDNQPPRTDLENTDAVATRGTQRGCYC
jgi:hypothetical protein